MIDTDKYEGHTLECGMHSARLLEHLNTEPNRRLIVDAVSLLEEVKRLREIEREWEQMWSKLEDYPDICAELICFMESEEE